VLIGTGIDCAIVDIDIVWYRCDIDIDVDDIDNDIDNDNIVLREGV
jgi:hypothetical protein